MSAPAPLTMRRAIAGLREIADSVRCHRCGLPKVAVAVELHGRGTGRPAAAHYTAARYTKRCTCPPLPAAEEVTPAP